MKQTHQTEGYIIFTLVILAIAFVILLISISPYRDKPTPESLRITPTVTITLPPK